MKLSDRYVGIRIGGLIIRFRIKIYKIGRTERMMRIALILRGFFLWVNPIHVTQAPSVKPSATAIGIANKLISFQKFILIHRTSKMRVLKKAQLF